MTTYNPRPGRLVLPAVLTLALSFLGNNAAASELPDIVQKAIDFDIPTSAYNSSPLGRVDAGSKLLAKELFNSYGNSFFEKQASNISPSQELWDKYVAEVYTPLLEVMERQIDHLSGTSRASISSPDKVKARITKKLQEWSKKHFYHHFKAPRKSSTGFSQMKGEASKACSVFLNKLAAGKLQKPYTRTYENCYQPSSDLPGSNLTQAIPVRGLAAVLLRSFSVIHAEPGIPLSLIKALSWYAILNDEALSAFEEAMKDESGYKKLMMAMYQGPASQVPGITRQYSPEDIARILSNHSADLPAAYRKIWYYHDKYLAKVWYQQQEINNSF